MYLLTALCCKRKTITSEHLRLAYSQVQTKRTTSAFGKKQDSSLCHKYVLRGMGGIVAIKEPIMMGPVGTRGLQRVIGKIIHGIH